MSSMLVLLCGVWALTAALGLLVIVVLAVFCAFDMIDEQFPDGPLVLLGWLIFWPLLVPIYLAVFLWYTVCVLPSRKYKE